MVIGIEALAGTRIKLPAMQRAHHVAIFNYTELGQICFAVWTVALHDVITKLNLSSWFIC